MWLFKQIMTVTDTADLAVCRESDGTWYILNQPAISGFGTVGDIPAVGDYDGDGESDAAIFRPSVNQCWILRSTDGLIAMTFGTGVNTSAPSDLTGDGKTDVVQWKESTGEWFVLRSDDNFSSFYAFPYGASGDIPVPADYNCDGTPEPAVFRPSTNIWYQLQPDNSTVVAVSLETQATFRFHQLMLATKLSNT